jgi:hypothetical protein
MKSLLIYLPALACLAMAAIVCLPMLLNHRKHEPDSELVRLKEEVAALKAQLAIRDAEKVTADG